MSYRNFWALLAFAAAVSPAQAGGPTVSDGWFRSLPNGLPAAGYFTLKNNTTEPISLTGAVSPVCGMLMLHKSEVVGGMNRMTMVDRVDVPQRGTVKFAPGGYHLMCMDPGAKMKPGGSVPVTLQFADGTTINVEFPVRTATGK